MPLDDFLHTISEHKVLSDALTHTERLPAKSAVYRDLSLPIPASLAIGLKLTGIHKFYSHQAQAIDFTRDGNNIVVITPTASGKSLIYNICVLTRILLEEHSHALFLFPLKALAQDQYSKLNNLIDASDLKQHVTVGLFDGDTPSNQRTKLKHKPPSILISNPDMLHHGIMSFHQSWERFLRGLKFIVLDELHIYRGVFGSHILHVLHRLDRLCRYYGAHPQYIATSATIAGAKDLAQELTGQPFELIEDSGAPVSVRKFLFFKPEESYLSFALKLFVQALHSGLKVIAFTKARRTTELLHRWLNESYPQLANRVSSYRAGYLPEERRAIEAALTGGTIDGVISTSALEMGIDIGGLDVCILVGYPGTVAATWQRAGRVGRGTLPSVVCLVAGEDQLDQFIVRSPDNFFARSSEKAIVDAANKYIAKPHILCAATELPIGSDDPLLKEPRTLKLVEELTAEGKLLQSASGDQWFSSLTRPQRLIDIRGGGSQFTIELKGSRKILGSIGGRAVFAECHPGAIYLHHGEQYLVDELDTGGTRVVVEKTNAPYYTTALFDKETEVLEELSSRELVAGTVTLNRLLVRERLIGYQRRKINTRAVISRHELEYPPQAYETVGVTVRIHPGSQELCSEGGSDFRGGIHGVEHAMLALAPLFALCDRNDMGGYSQLMHPQIAGPSIFLYDGYPGGIGLAARLFEVFPDLVARTLKLVRGCECEIGCPSCIQSPKCGSGNVPLDKGAAIITLEVMAGVKQPPPEINTPSPPFNAPLPRKGESEVGTNNYAHKSKPKIVVPPPNFKPVPIPATWPHELNGVVFDIETMRGADEVGGWSNIHKMGLAWASVYKFPQNEWLDFEEDNVDELIKLFRDVDLIVGFNHVRFDFTVLTNYTNLNFNKLPSYDIMLELNKALGHRLSLNAVAQATLGASKTADGMQSLEWYRNGEIDKVAKYCRHDVEVTRDLFFHILEKRYVLFEKKGIGLVRAQMRLPEIITCF